MPGFVLMNTLKLGLRFVQCNIEKLQIIFMFVVTLIIFCRLSPFLLSIFKQVITFFSPAIFFLHKLLELSYCPLDAICVCNVVI